MVQQLLDTISHDLTPDGAREFDVIRVVDTAALHVTPFHHVRLENVFPADLYREMLKNFPAAENFEALRHHDAMRDDGSSTRLIMPLEPKKLSRLPDEQRQVWTTVAAAVCSPELEAAFKRKFRTALEHRFWRAVERIPLRAKPILVRDLPGYRIRIHADVPTKAITVQFYLPSDASQSHLGTIFHTTKRKNGTDRPVAMQFLPASGYAFPVRRKKSWHSVPMTTEADGERRSIMLTYFVDGRLPEPQWRERAGILFGLGRR
jgi:hypothetical protein